MSKVDKAIADLKAGYEMEIRDLQEKLNKAEAQKSEGFYSNLARVSDLIAFEIEPNWASELDSKELGRLVTDFNDRFHYSLFVQAYYDNNMRGQYKLYAIRRYSNAFGPRPEDRKIAREDEIAMRHFVMGFAKGVRAFRKKRT